MSRYVVRVVQRDGVARFLVRGKLTDRQMNATHYPHPSNARQAQAKFSARFRNVYADVVDTRGAGMKPDGGPAFPRLGGLYDGPNAKEFVPPQAGMSLRDYFAAAALGNPAICTGVAQQWEIVEWFGASGGIRKEQIIAKQAAAYADAMLAERVK